MPRLVDSVCRVSTSLEPDVRLSAESVCMVLDWTITPNGHLTVIGFDNGPEFVSKEVNEWAFRRGINHWFSRSKKPTGNAYCESFNEKVRAEYFVAN